MATLWRRYRVSVPMCVCRLCVCRRCVCVSPLCVCVCHRCVYLCAAWNMYQLTLLDFELQKSAQTQTHTHIPREKYIHTDAHKNIAHSHTHTLSRGRERARAECKQSVESGALKMCVKKCCLLFRAAQAIALPKRFCWLYRVVSWTDYSYRLQAYYCWPE